MMDNADAPIRAPHAVVPRGQMDTDDTGKPQDMDTQDGLQPPNVTALRRMFDEARNLTERARKEQQIDQDYYDGPAQLSGEMRETLRRRGQPLIFDNRIAPAIDGILGTIEQAKVDPRCFPRTPQDEGAADVGTKTLRFIADRAKWQQAKLDCAEDYLKQGIAAAIVEYDADEVQARHVRWETFFYDPRSRKNDFKDAKYLGIVKWMYADEVRQAYPDRGTKLGDLTVSAENAVDETFQDRPEDQVRWVDKRTSRILVVEIYYQHAGEWLRCVYCAAGWLEYGKSPYLNARTGETRCPIEAVSFKVDRENHRYGPIRNMRPMQDEVNGRRSRGLHLVNSRQVMIDPDMYMPVDTDEVRREAARADGVLPAGTRIMPTADLAQGNLAMLQEAKDSLSRMVPVAISQDLREGTATSGRARQVAQQAGLTQFGRGFGRIEDFEERIFRQMWLCAQQFKTDQWYVRVTDNPRAPEFLKVNEPQMGMVLQPQPVAGPDGQPMIDPSTGQPAVQMMPTMGVVGYNNRIAEMDLDIIVGTVGDTVALEQEVFDSLMDLVRSGVDPFSPQFELLLELAPLPDKAGVMEKITALRERLQQQQAQAQQAAQQAEAEERAANIAKTAAQTRNLDANTQGKQVETEKNVLDALLANHLEDQQATA